MLDKIELLGRGILNAMKTIGEFLLDVILFILIVLSNPVFLLTFLWLFGCILGIVACIWFVILLL